MAGLESFFGKQDLSDVEVLIHEDADQEQDASVGSKRKLGPWDERTPHQRQQQQELKLPGHKLILCAKSDVFNTQVLNWPPAPAASSSQNSSSLQLRLAVPAGQLEVGRLLLRSIYQQQPDFSNTNQQTLLQLLVLADRYGVPDVVAAAAGAFKGVSTEQMAWETLRQVYQLPAACADNTAAFGSAFSAAAAKLQHELGDLELVFADAGKQQLLLGLPHAALLQLLRDPATCVTSENTAAHAVLVWTRHNAPKAQPLGPTPAQRAFFKQHLPPLAAEVRMCRCSQLYILSKLMADGDFVESCGGRQLRQAAMCGVSKVCMADIGRELSKEFPGWFAKQRPASAVTQLTIDWKLPLTELQPKLEQLLQTGTPQFITSPRHFWQGCSFQVQLQVVRNTPAAAAVEGQAAPAATVDAGLYLQSCNAAVCEVAAKIELCRPTGRLELAFNPAAGPIVHSLDPHCFTSSGWGFPGMVLSAVAATGWGDAEAALRARGLVHADGGLHIRAQPVGLK